MLLVEVQPDRVDAAQPRRELHRGRPLRGAARARRHGADPGDDRLRRAARGRRDPDRAADAALGAARARPLDRPRARRGASPRACRRASSSSSSRRPTPARPASALKPVLEESGLKAGEDFHLAFSPERVDPGREDWTTKTTPKVVGGLTAECTRRAAELYASALDTVDAAVVARGGGADEAAREHLPLGQHRARQRARAALRPDGTRHLGGRRRGSDEAVRLHALRARARASAGTASRSTRSTSRGRRASTTSTPSSSSSRARSTRTCRTSAAR